MPVLSSKPEKLFTIEQANATLPLVRVITADIVALSRDVADRRHRLGLFVQGRKLRQGDPYADELAQMETQLQQDMVRLADYVTELRQLGVEPKEAFEGLVDFPCLLDGRQVLLCWKLGEPEITHWHEMESGYEDRVSLVAGVGGDSSNSEEIFKF